MRSARQNQRLRQRLANSVGDLAKGIGPRCQGTQTNHIGIKLDSPPDRFIGQTILGPLIQ